VILSDTEIKAALAGGRLVIKPPPPDGHYTTSAVDLTCKGDFHRWKSPAGAGLSVSIDPDDPDHDYTELARRYQERVPVESDGSIILQPERLVLCQTEEWVEFPEEGLLAARVEGRSTLARYGVGIHVTAPTIHSGYRGFITLEITSRGPFPIRLRKGSRICQLVIEQLCSTPTKRLTGVFQGATTVAGGQGRAPRRRK
jgi:dCTP deaminase